MRLIAAFVLGMVACIGAHGQTLWHGIPINATVKQVHELLPGATDVANPQPIGPKSPGLLGLIEYKGFRLAGANFGATLYFKNGRLVRVKLSPLQAPKGDDGYGVAGRLRASLMAKYGKPLDETDNNRSMMSGYDLNWANNSVQILYEYAQIGETAFITVYYTASQDEANL